MSDTKWTQGPWFNTSEDDSVIGEVMDQPLDSGVTMHISIHGANAKNDARLIAAAPELYEALRYMLAGWKYIRATYGDMYGVGWNRAQGKAESAIRKANPVCRECNGTGTSNGRDGAMIPCLACGR